MERKTTMKKDRFIKELEDSEYDNRYSHLLIVLEDEQIELPKFKTKDMYKGMELDKAYTLEGLNLL